MRGRFCKVVFSEQDVILGFVAEFDAMAHTVTAILLLFSFAYGSQACELSVPLYRLLVTCRCMILQALQTSLCRCSLPPPSMSRGT